MSAFEEFLLPEEKENQKPEPEPEPEPEKKAHKTFYIGSGPGNLLFDFHDGTWLDSSEVVDHRRCLGTAAQAKALWTTDESSGLYLYKVKIPLEEVEKHEHSQTDGNPAHKTSG